MAVGWDQDVAHERWKWRHGHEGMVIHTTTKVWCVNVDCQKGVDLF
jgi:DNA/RNA-binding domain of Phe-tRNA-synthetase-like protein